VDKQDNALISIALGEWTNNRLKPSLDTNIQTEPKFLKDCY
jgi:hypothetical protein